ncbi:MAG: hypothetical protein JNJ93_06980 [Acinetobacter sp.]|nr:hypothetical protein [Acinetobacter sp.]
MESASFQKKLRIIYLNFQLAVYNALMSQLYKLMQLIMLCAFLALGAAAYLLFYRGTPQVTALDHLDGREWTLSAAGGKQRVQISHIIDHQAYIVLYFQHARAKPVIVWRDQVALKQWKSFKVLAKML